LEEVYVLAGHEVLKEVDINLTDFWQSTRDFGPAAQALQNLLIVILIIILNLKNLGPSGPKAVKEP
jgi:hypothetical protein